MSVKFKYISQWEKEYHFEDAVVEMDVLNGMVGKVEDGKFVPAEGGNRVIMQNEVGDDMYMPEYKITKGSHVRTLKIDEMNGKFVEFYDFPLPTKFKVGDKLASDANGALVVGASAAPYFEITKIIGNKLGVECVIVAE